jgi:serine/threonine protein kinase
MIGGERAALTSAGSCPRTTATSGTSRLRSWLLLGARRPYSGRRLLVLVVEERQKSLLAGLLKLTSMTPPAGGVFCASGSATSRPVTGATIGRQGKAEATAKPVSVETSKTLVRGEIHVSDERAGRRGELLLDRYRLLDRLGSGGFGTVWRARDEQLARTVALKRIALPSPEDRARALREAHATARLAHPGIVALYEACSDQDAFYLISELVEGETLARLIEQDALCDEEIVEVGLTLADALEHAHARGVVHRDVKPQNVLIPDQDVPGTAGRSVASPAAAKLADFGGALVAGGEDLTQTGDVFGTLAYMAPEQSDGHAAGPPADLYSLALVLYEALTGVNPVRGRTPAATARRIGGPIAPLQRRRRDLPGELTRSIDSALVADPEHRGSLVELHEALEQTLERGLKRRLFARRAEGDRSSKVDATRLHETAGPVLEGVPAITTEPFDAPAGHSHHPQPGFAGDHGPQAGDASEPSRARRLALPRGVWLGWVLALAAWQGATGRGGVALLLLAAAAPLLLLARRSGPGWLAAATAPALGYAGLAAAFPALAGQRTSWQARAGLAALGFWWLTLAEPLLARRLWLGPASGLPPRDAWEASLTGTASHVLGPILTPQLAIGAFVWALSAILLPWVVRGRNAGLDVLLAIAWTVALLAAAPLIERPLLAHSNQGSPRGLLLGAMLGCALAVCARALRGPVTTPSL